MASYNIPEDVIGIPLFVPDAHNFFSIETAGMPNGENCLKIHGATNRNYKAFQPAQTLTPNVFLDRTTSTFSMTFWFKHPNLGGSASPGANILFAVMNANMNSTVIGVSLDYVWAVALWTSGSTRYLRYQCGSASVADATGFYTNSWHLATITKENNIASIYLDDILTPQVVGNSANAGVNGNMFLCIGCYSDLGAMNASDQDWYLGKLAFHDHVLNSTERALLYNAMTA